MFKAVYYGWEGLRSLWRMRRNVLLTLLIIAFGITALIAILTAVDALRKSLIETLGGVGGKSFELIVGGRLSIQINRKKLIDQGRKKRQRILPLTLTQIQAFQAIYPKENLMGIRLYVQTNAVARYQNHKTNPSISVMGASLSLLAVEENRIAQGRWLNYSDERLGLRVVVIGAQVAHTLFPNTNAIGKLIQLGDHYYEVIGVLEEKGTFLFSSLDKVCYIPLTTARAHVRNVPSYILSIKAQTPEKLTQAIQEARVRMRQVRGLLPNEEDDFTILNSTEIVDTLLSALRQIKIAALALGIITLIGASISLTNMMLIQVKERTREIGIRKALGASQKAILLQFLVESVGIALVGGIVGIGLGIILGNFVGIFLKAPFFIPWGWISVGLGLCSLSGVSAGLYPALQAARLDPVEALRYE